VERLLKEHGGDDALLMNAWNKIGEYYSDRHRWVKAAQYYTQVRIPHRMYRICTPATVNPARLHSSVMYPGVLLLASKHLGCLHPQGARPALWRSCTRPPYRSLSLILHSHRHSPCLCTAGRGLLCWGPSPP
jgi:hypothetical protein